MSDARHLVPVWIVYVDGERLEAVQEGADNTETEQAAGEEGDERAALYKEEVENVVNIEIDNTRVLPRYFQQRYFSEKFYVGDYFSGEYIAERVVHELSVSRGFTTEVYVKRNMSGPSSRGKSTPSVLDSERFQAREGAISGDASEEERDYRLTVYEEAETPAERNAEEETKVYGFGKIDSNYRGWTQQDDKWADNFLSNEEDEENIMGKQGCKVVAAAKMICTILGNDSFDPPRFIADGNRIVDSDGNLSQAAIIGAIKNAIAEAIPDAASRPEIKSDYFENQLNETVLKKLKNDPEYLNYILGRAHVGGGL